MSVKEEIPCSACEATAEAVRNDRGDVTGYKCSNCGALRNGPVKRHNPQASKKHRFRGDKEGKNAT